VPFIRALGELIDEGALRREKVCVKIIERYPQDSLRLITRYKLTDVFKVLVGLPHIDAIREQANASVLLLVIRADFGGIGIYTAKLFEYLGARRPILALAPKEGVAASLVREANAGIVVDSANRQEIKEAILRYYSEHERTGSVRYCGKDEVIRRYERPVLAGRLAKILDSVATP
jgi:glycosyltransferase involved in cell wall biosynthesis